MSSIFGGNCFIFACDFDEKNNRWWFEDESNCEPSGKMFYISGDDVPNEWNCYNVAQMLIDKQLSPIYPKYKFYKIQTNHNCQIFDNETHTFYPSYRFTIMIWFKDITKPKNKKTCDGSSIDFMGFDSDEEDEEEEYNKNRLAFIATLNKRKVM